MNIAKLNCPPLTPDDILAIRGEPMAKQVEHDRVSSIPQSEEWSYYNTAQNIKEFYMFKNGHLVEYRTDISNLMKYGKTVKRKSLLTLLVLFFTLCGFSAIEAKGIEEAYQDKLINIKSDDIDGHYQLGLWCKQNKLPDRAQEQFEKVITLDPEHQKARQELGYVKYKDEWITGEEKEERIAKEKGFVKYGDKWMSSKEMESSRTKDRLILKWNFDYKIQSKRYLVYTSADEEYAKQIINISEILYQEINKSILKDSKINLKSFPLKIRIFKDRTEMINQMKSEGQNPPPWAGGRYNIDTSLCDVYQPDKSKQNSYADCLHEQTHQIMHQVLKSVLLQDWLDEGLACYFSNAKIKDKKMLLAEVDATAPTGEVYNQYKNKIGEIGLKKIITMNTNYWETVPKEQVKFLYATAWSFIHFLFNYKNGLYREKLVNYIDDTKNGGTKIQVFETLIDKIDVLEPLWLEYAKNIKIDD
jgi:hypothetical protein